MANDRMFLRCPCGALFGIAKHMACEWYVKEQHQASLGAKLNAWFLEHQYCEDGTLHPRPTIVLETDEGFLYGQQPETYGT